MDLGLQGARALVTAASSGLGRSCASALAAEGAEVFIASRDHRRVAATAREIGAAHAMACDLRIAGDITGLVARAVQVMGGLDVLVVNSGPPPAGSFRESDDEVWSVTHDLVFMSAVRLLRESLPHLAVSGRGRVVTITGFGLREPTSDLVASEAARAAVAVVAKVLASDLAPTGVTVNNIAPGPILTERLLGLHAKSAAASGLTKVDQLRHYAETIPVRRLGNADEVGALCAFLCSTSAGFLTGQTIVVDGGLNRGV